MSPPQSEADGLDDTERCQSEESLGNGAMGAFLVDAMSSDFFCCSTEVSSRLLDDAQQTLDSLPSVDLTSGAKEGRQHIVFQVPLPRSVFTSTQSPSLPKEVKPQWVHQRRMRSSDGALRGF